MTTPAATAINILDIISQYAPRNFKTNPSSVRGRYSMACPLPGHTTDTQHQDYSGSFSVDAPAQMFKCFGCGGQGNAWQLQRTLGYGAPVAFGDGPTQASSNPKATGVPPTHTGVTLAELAKDKGLDPKLLRDKLGWQDVSYYGKPAVKIPYADPAGKDPQYRLRINLSGPDRFRWEKGAQTRPLGLPQLAQALNATPASPPTDILLVEGETDLAAATQCGILALGIPGAATFRKEWAQHLEPFSTIYVWQEPGQSGTTFVASAVRALGHTRVLIVAAPSQAKDPAELHHLMGYVKFKATMAALFTQATPAEPATASQGNNGPGRGRDQEPGVDDYSPYEQTGEFDLVEPDDFPGPDTEYHQNDTAQFSLKNLGSAKRWPLSRGHWYERLLGQKSLMLYHLVAGYNVGDFSIEASPDGTINIDFIHYRSPNLSKTRALEVLRQAIDKRPDNEGLWRLYDLRATCSTRQNWHCKDHGVQRDARRTCRSLCCQGCPSQATQNVGGIYLADLTGGATRTTYVIRVQLPAVGDISTAMEELGQAWPKAWRRATQRQGLRGKVCHRAEKWVLDRRAVVAHSGSSLLCHIMVEETEVGELRPEIERLAASIGGTIFLTGTTAHGLTAVGQLMEDAAFNLVECAADTPEETRDLFLAWYLTTRRRTTFQPAGAVKDAYEESRVAMAEDRKTFDPADVRCEVMLDDGSPCGMVCTHYWYPDVGPLAGQQIEVLHSMRRRKRPPA